MAWWCSLARRVLLHGDARMKNMRKFCPILQDNAEDCDECERDLDAYGWLMEVD